MDTTSILHFLSESVFLLVVFGVFLTIGIWRGRQTIINLICGLYLALLLSLQFPYYDLILGELNQSSVIAAAKLIFFFVITILCTLLFKRIMPEEYREGNFESFGKKLMLAAGATILVMIFSFNVLPVTEFLTPGSPVQALFAPEQYFFGWLVFPLIILILN
jgi:hypothetical protein